MGLGWCWSMCSEGYLMVLTRHCSPSLLPPFSLPPPLPPALPLPPPSAWPCTARTGTGSSSTMPATLRGSPHSSGERIWSCAQLALSTTYVRVHAFYLLIVTSMYACLSHLLLPRVLPSPPRPYHSLLFFFFSFSPSSLPSPLSPSFQLNI